MRTVHIEAKPDHLLRLARLKDPVGAVAELIRNGLDAEAHRIEVDVEVNDLGGVEFVSVEDDGHGMPHGSCPSYFGGLGGSWKTDAKVSPELKRGLHGRSGQGRFRAFALGAQVRWTTLAEGLDGGLEATEITGSLDRPTDFEISPPREARGSAGTRVEVSGPADFINRLVEDGTARQLASMFAPFLTAHPDVEIVYRGERLDPSLAWAGNAEYTLNWRAEETAPVRLRVIEWEKDVGRILALCDASGVVLDGIAPGIQAPGYHFTAYLLWDGFIERRNELPLAELDDIAELLDLAREQLRVHFKERDRERRSRLIQEWKRDEVYPYADGPAEPAQVVERQVFDEVATTLARQLPSGRQTRKTTLRLLKEVISHDPSGLFPVLDELFRLPRAEQEELKRILQRTTLAEVIKATSQVTARLDFLAALKLLVFDPELRGTVKERAELHKILERETWIFGDAYSLMVSDRSLDTVLRRHLHILGRETTREESAPVRREDGSRGIVDLMLGRAHRGSSGREHLIVELKAPKVKIGQEETSQIKSYAQAVVKDPQFHDAGVTWSFWVVSSEMDDIVRQDAASPHTPPGCIQEWGGGVRIWAKTWSELIEECEDRLHFYRDQLNHDPATEHALDHLARFHAPHTPAIPRQGTTAARI